MKKECVRWQRVDKYLKESSFSTSGEIAYQQTGTKNFGRHGKVAC